MLSRECSSKNAATSYPRLRKYKSAPCYQINRWIPFRFSNKTFVRSVAISAGLIPGAVFARKERNLKLEEIRAILDFINRILYGTVIAKRSAGKIETGQVQDSDAVAAVTAKNTCHCAYIIQSLYLLCKRTSAVRRDGTHRFDMVLKVIVYFLYCRAAKLQQKGPRRQTPKNYPPSCEKRKFPSCGKFGKM